MCDIVVGSDEKGICVFLSNFDSEEQSTTSYQYYVVDVDDDVHSWIAAFRSVFVKEIART